MFPIGSSQRAHAAAYLMEIGDSKGIAASAVRGGDDRSYTQAHSMSPLETHTAFSYCDVLGGSSL
jgi:hypothetical protein